MGNHELHEPTPTVVSTRYGRVEYAEFGAGPAVLALHGAMGGYDQSLLLARTIGDAGYRYIAVSRPGYLGTPLSSGKTPMQQADLCAELLDALHIRTAAVMAVSGGGPCALQFALRHQQRCRGLVLVSTCGEKVNTPIPFSFHLTRLLVRWPACANAMQKKALANIEQMASRSIANPVLRARTLQDPDAGPLFTALLTSTCEHMAQRMPGTENDIAITRTTDYRLEEIAVPTLIVHGTADSMVPFAQHARALASRIPGAELLAIEGGEHVSIFTHRPEVKARVAPFLHAHASFAGNATASTE
ncbi:MAG TPA: alpha/beta hydrolase [Armatimonadota bacterium]|jgi:pimeloyl-ACP methyl ester carboxylesterase